MKTSRILASLALVTVLGACSTSTQEDNESHNSATPAASSSPAATHETHEETSQEAAPQQDIRAMAASVLMPPATNYDDAKAKLDAGVGGIFIPSWADPNLLQEKGRDINALRQEVGRDFEVSIDFEGGRVQRFSELLGEYPAPQQMAAERSPQEVEQLAHEIGRSLKAHGITVDRVITDNGNNYRAADFTAKVVSLGGRHHRIRPYTPRHNGKVERYNRLMVDEVLYARPYTSETARREALAVWVNHYNYHRPHTSCGDAPPASLAPTRVNNVMPSYS